MKIKGNNNTVIKTITTNNSSKKRRKVTLIIVLGFIASTITITEFVYSPIKNFLAEKEISFYQKDGYTNELSIKPMQNVKQPVILNNLEIALQEAKHIRSSEAKDIELTRIVNECLIKGKFTIAIDAAKSASRKQRDILLELIINEALLDVKNYQYARKAVDNIRNSNKRDELQIKIVKAFNQ